MMNFLHENRLIHLQHPGSSVNYVGAGYDSYTGRFIDELQHYDYTNVVEVIAATNTAFWKSLGLEPLLTDGGRIIDGSSDPVPNHDGLLAETREATLGALGNIFLHGKPFQGIIQMVNVPGALAIDTGNALVGMNHATAA